MTMTKLAKKKMPQRNKCRTAVLRVEVAIICYKIWRALQEKKPIEQLDMERNFSFAYDRFQCRVRVNARNPRTQYRHHRNARAR